MLEYHIDVIDNLVLNTHIVFFKRNLQQKIFLVIQGIDFLIYAVSIRSVNLASVIDYFTDSALNSVHDMFLSVLI